MEGSGRTLALLAALGIAGCRDEGEDPELAMSAEYARVVCAVLFDEICPCEETGWTRQDQCEVELHPLIRDMQLNAIAVDLTFDQACLERHLDAIAALSCDSTWTDEGERCLVYHGEEPRDAACSDYGQHMSSCEQGLVCTLSVCLPQGEFPPPLAAGEACADANGFPIASCDVGLACAYAGTRTCVVPAALGEPCPGNAPCAASWCDQGTCAPLRPLGEACSDNAQCETGYCATVCSEIPDLPGSCVALGL